MTLLDILASVRALLQASHPAVYIRDAIPLDSQGRPALPERCIIIDLIIDNKVRDYSSVYSSVLVQIGCWSNTVAEALTDLEAARTALEAEGWEMVRVNGTLTDETGARGATADFQNIY